MEIRVLNGRRSHRIRKSLTWINGHGRNNCAFVRNVDIGQSSFSQAAADLLLVWNVQVLSMYF